MRVLLQRVRHASVMVSSKEVGRIDHGLLLFSCFTEGDTVETMEWMAKKIVSLRIFDDEHGVMNKSLLDVKGALLSVSQFTLYAVCDKGCRPSYRQALPAGLSFPLYEKWNEILTCYAPVSCGRFGEHMEVTLTNDGPVTILLER